MTDRIIANEASRAGAIQAIRDLDLTRPFRMTLKRKASKRSLNQNSLFHMWCAEIAEQTGNDAEAVKEALKHMFLPPRIIEMGERQVEVRRSTAALSTDDMARFMKAVEGWGRGEGYYLTAPEFMHAEAAR